jgi:hypothetical protein
VAVTSNETEESKVVPISVARARRRIANHFYALQAFEPEKAIEFAPQTSDELREFDRLRADGVIRQQVPGHYWFDLDIHQAAKKRRGMRILPILATVLLVLVWAWALFYR